MFAQIGRSLGQSEGGLGIGLALAKRLVEMHEGSIEARSEGLGKGSEFVVRLPLPESSRQQVTTRESFTAVEKPEPKRRILIADDNRDVAESCQIMLQILGHEVEKAFDGVEALEKAEQFRPDLIVLDIGMPKLNGLETARRLREQPWARDTILIAMTGWGGDEDKRESAEAGFNVHLVKPVDGMAIQGILDRIGESKAGFKARKILEPPFGQKAKKEQA